MNILAWNCQGLGSPWAVRELGEVLKTHDPGVIFLSETKCTVRKIDSSKTRFNLFGIAVQPNGRSGGLALLWKKDINVLVQSFSKHHIDAHIYFEEYRWRLTGYYGEPETSSRVQSWELLKKLSAQSRIPWLVCGDFNEILQNSEKRGGSDRAIYLMRNFRETLEFCGLGDLGHEGDQFTWCNNRLDPDTIWARLDRGCATSEWKNLWPNATVHHIELRHSDHKAVCIRMAGDLPRIAGQRRKRRFRFEASWLTNDQCSAIITEEWNRNCSSTGFKGLIEKMGNCRVGLLKWATSDMSETKKKIVVLRERISHLKKRKLTDETRDLIQTLNNELDSLLDSEELYWKQRGKGHWLKEGDRNTAFFHSRASARRKMNLIRGLLDKSGVWREDKASIEKLAVNHFCEMFKSIKPIDLDMQHVLDAIEPVSRPK